MVGGIGGRADEDGPVEEPELGLVGMRDVAVAHHRPFDRPPLLDDPRRVIRAQRETDILGVDVCVEAAAEGQVVPDLPHALDRHLLVEVDDEGGDVAEPDLPGDPVGHRGDGLDLAGGGVDPQRGLGSGHGEDPGVEHDLGEGDDPVTAHRREPLVVEEQHREVTVGADGGADEAAVHVGMPPWLPHQSPSQLVEVSLGMATPLEHRRPRYLRAARHHHPKRLASCVRLDAHHSSPIGGRGPFQCGVEVHTERIRAQPLASPPGERARSGT